MSNKFISFLKKVGLDIEKYVMPVAETAGEVAVSVFAPGLGPLFNQTVAAVVTAEQNFAAAGQQSGTGVQKLAAVVGVAGSLIKQGLVDAGVSNPTQAQVEGYISSVVTILNAVPATFLTPGTAPVTVPTT
jgi:hypothetical protein